MRLLHRAEQVCVSRAVNASTDRPAVPGTRLRIANFVLCQLGWLAAVLGAAHGAEAWGCAVVIAVMAWHLSQAVHPLRESTLLVITTFLGLVAEAALAHLDAFHYVSALSPSSQPPPWLVLLWPLLGCMLNVSLRWLHGRYLLAAVCGAVAGPLAFFGGARLGAAQIHDASTLWLAQTIVWAVMFPLLLAVARRFDGMAPKPVDRGTPP